MLGAILAAQLATTSATPPPPRAVETTSQLSIAGGFRCDVRGCLVPVFSLGLRVDVLYHPGPRAYGVGAFLSTRSDNFADIAPTLGASLLLPVTEAFPIVVSAGGALRIDSVGVAGGPLERVWFGARSYNFQTPYVFSGGAFVEGRQFVAGANSGWDVIFGFDGDLEILAIPWIALYTWIARTDRRH